MKANIINGEKKFIPIKLEILIESEAELCELYHRMNCNELPKSYRSTANNGTSRTTKGLYQSGVSGEYTAFGSTVSRAIYDLIAPFVPIDPIN